MHDSITLEHAFPLDVIGWTSFMDIYHTLGLHGDAYRLWEQMVCTGRYNAATVSVVFDVCAWAKSRHSLNRVLAQLAQDKFVLNKKNWNSLVEAYLRLGMYNEAAKAVCVEMPAAGIPPDQKNVQTVWQFVHGQEAVVKVIMGRVERYLPEQWAELPASYKRGLS